MAPSAVFSPGEFHGQRSLVGYSPWGCEELDITDQLTHTHTHTFFIIASKIDLYLWYFGVLLEVKVWITIHLSFKQISFLNLRINFLGQFWKCFILIFENYFFKKNYLYSLFSEMPLMDPTYTLTSFL